MRCRGSRRASCPGLRKSGQRLHRKGNPIGRDGRPLRCSICDSEDHLRANCPRGGKGAGKGTPAMHTQAALEQHQGDGPLAALPAYEWPHWRPSLPPSSSSQPSPPTSAPTSPAPSAPTMPAVSQTAAAASASASSGSGDPWFQFQGQDPWQSFVPTSVMRPPLNLVGAVHSPVGSTSPLPQQ